MQLIDTSRTQAELIRTESERIMEYFDSLSPEDLEKPSPCERWTVGEVIAHLVWHVETYRGMMERGLVTTFPPLRGCLRFPLEHPIGK